MALISEVRRVSFASTTRRATPTTATRVPKGRVAKSATTAEEVHNVKVRVIPNRMDYEPEERRNMWYTRDEMIAMKNNNGSSSILQGIQDSMEEVFDEMLSCVDEEDDKSSGNDDEKMMCSKDEERSKSAIINRTIIKNNSNISNKNTFKGTEMAISDQRRMLRALYFAGFRAAAKQSLQQERTLRSQPVSQQPLFSSIATI